MNPLAVLRGVAVAAAMSLQVKAGAGAEPRGQASPEARAVAWLAGEVPRWQRENNCYSCHNNGDAVRGLATAQARGLLTDAQPLADTLRFLNTPERWDGNGPEGPFKDRDLARLQFAAALAGAVEAKLIPRGDSAAQAARLLVELQQEDGSWKSDPGAAAGSPVTYGQALATAMAVRALITFGAPEQRAAIERGVRWCEQLKPQSVLNAAAILWVLASVDSAAAKTQRVACTKVIAAGESPAGGWGPFVSSPPEVFDSALVVLALADFSEREKVLPMLERGRSYLLSMQEADGSWPATTRPRGGESYAQQVSTTGWATLALLATKRAE